MSQPQWITPAGDLGTIADGVYYSLQLRAEASARPVFYRRISGQLPPGMNVGQLGQLSGIPQTQALIGGEVVDVPQDVTSTFAVRAYTTVNDQPQGQILRLADRTFTMTVANADRPAFVTPSGQLAQVFDLTPQTLEIEFQDTEIPTRLAIVSGQLPPGLALDPVTGIISGVITSIPLNLLTQSYSVDYQFTVEARAGLATALQTYSIRVLAHSRMTADSTLITADNTEITADVTNVGTPILLDAAGSIGTVRDDNVFAYQFQATDPDGDAVEFVLAGSIPPRLTFYPDTGWLTGAIADLGPAVSQFDFSLRVRKRLRPEIISEPRDFSINVTGSINADITWITDPDLGSVINGSISTLSVRATTTVNIALQYQLVSGSNSRLPQGLTLLPSGNIVGRVSFNSFALDSGTTTFDQDLDPRFGIFETTFDVEYSFDVNAYDSDTVTQGYSLRAVTVISGGTGYTGQPLVLVSPPPPGPFARAAQLGQVTINGGQITAIEVLDAGSGYAAAPLITIQDGGGIGAQAVAQISGTNPNPISAVRRFRVRLDRVFNRPYQNLYIKCMPPAQDRELIQDLVQNQDIIPVQFVYRADDPNFGVSQSVIYKHAFGLTVDTTDSYVSSLAINHYWKNLVLGPISTARAVSVTGEVLYEVVYSQIIDDLVNSQGQSVSKEVDVPFPILLPDSSEIDKVYPNSLINMRDQVIDVVGQISPALPLWMTSKQDDGSVLGFQPAWVIAYVLPGRAEQVAYNIQQRFGNALNVIDFKVDRYEIDRSQTYDWDPVTQRWLPQPAAETTFDDTPTPLSVVPWQDNQGFFINWINNFSQLIPWFSTPSTPTFQGTTFDHGSTRFITPTTRWRATDAFDKYLVFPRTNILE